ncbi:MAG TPA: threonine/serine dehydratase [Acidobacteriota bacterium]|nr:threonine/serine dehydratase [Acidobacteriota bacterium]
MITLADVEKAARVIEGKLHRTPSARSATLSEETGLDLHFKLEMFQKTGSFKVRGVINKLSSLSQEEKQRGVVSMSSGNHAQALSFGARLEGVSATIVMPSWSRQGKVAATRSYGGQVVLTEEPLMDVVKRLQDERGLTFVHPFDDPLVMAGQGTLALEMLEDVPDIDVALVTIGGGGLISGIATALKGRNPRTRVIGIEPVGAPAMTNSLSQGSPAHLDKVDTVCDGLAAPFAGQHTFEVVKRHVEEVVLVEDSDTVEAMALILERLKVVPEASAAAALVPVLKQQVDIPQGATVACVLCGGNVDARTLGQLLSNR